jgi:CheY-like chemotaxis protein
MPLCDFGCSIQYRPIARSARTLAAFDAESVFSNLKERMAPRKLAVPLTVLVVDDFPDGRELVAEYLTFRGFDVHVACDGAEAVALARKFRPAIVLMDLSMPGIDGWQAARMLKSDPNTQAIIVIAVTAHALKRERDAATAAGCDGVISKPFDLTALADALPRVLKRGPAALDVPGLSATPSRRAHARRRSARQAGEPF